MTYFLGMGFCSIRSCSFAVIKTATPLRKVSVRNVNDRVECCYYEKYGNFCSPLKLCVIITETFSPCDWEWVLTHCHHYFFNHVWFKSLLSGITTLKPSVSAANKVVIARKGSNVTLIPPCQEGYISYNLRLLGNQRTRINKKLQQGRNSLAALLKND